MDNKLRLALGVPTIENVDYDRIYRFSSDDLDLEHVFTPYLNNRGLSFERQDTKGLLNHIEEMKAVMLKAGSMDDFPPITVDIKNLVIADGNCRWNAAIGLLKEGLIKSITIRVVFRNIPEEEFDDYVITLNTSSKSWTLNDYIYNYAGRTDSNSGHAKLIKFCESHECLRRSNGGIAPRYGLAILNKTASAIKSNSFELTDEELEKGSNCLAEALRVREILMNNKDVKANGGGWFEPYLKAWAEFRCDHPSIDVKRYYREVKESIDKRKTKVSIPYGSNKKREWNTLFSAVLSYC